MPMLAQRTPLVALPVAQLARRSYHRSTRPSGAAGSPLAVRQPEVGRRPAGSPRHQMAEASSRAAAGAVSPDPQDVVVQYVILRRDLWKEHGWPLGSIVAQGCHASTAAVWQNQNDDTVRAYFSPENLDSMHKVVLEIKGETQLLNLSSKLEEAGILHKLWVEQPEDFPTCLATKPYPKSEVAQYFKKLQLCKGT